MKIKTRLKLRAAYKICKEEGRILANFDLASEETIKFMQDYAKVDRCCVINWLTAGH